jgi:hypothetical protein
MPLAFAAVTCINSVRYGSSLSMQVVLQADEVLVLLRM